MIFPPASSSSPFLKMLRRYTPICSHTTCASSKVNNLPRKPSNMVSSSLTHLSQSLKPLPPQSGRIYTVYNHTLFLCNVSAAATTLFVLLSVCSNTSLSWCQAPVPYLRGHTAQALIPFIKLWLNCKTQIIVSLYYYHFLILVLVLSLSSLLLSVSYSLFFTLTL